MLSGLASFLPANKSGFGSCAVRSREQNCSLPDSGQSSYVIVVKGPTPASPIQLEPLQSSSNIQRVTMVRQLLGRVLRTACSFVCVWLQTMVIIRHVSFPLCLVISSGILYHKFESSKTALWKKKHMTK